MASIEALFKNALCEEALRRGINLQPDAICESFALTNAAHGTAVKCFRVDVNSIDDLPKLAGLGAFRRSYPGVICAATAQILDVDCVLSGPLLQSTPVDWFGVPTGALG